MSLLQTIKNVFRGKVNELDEALQNPIRDGKLGIQDAHREIDELTDQLHDIITASERANLDIKEKHTEVEKYEKIAVLAGGRGEVDDVRQALEKKNKFQGDIDFLTNELAENKKLEADIREKLDNLEKQVDEMETSSERLSTSVEFQQLRAKIARKSANSGGSAAPALDSLKKAEEKARASANAWEQISDDANKGKALERKYETSSVSDDEVNKYLKK